MAGTANERRRHSSGVAAISTVQVGALLVTALVDAVGEFPGPREGSFAGASDEDWRHAAMVDPAAFGVGSSWRLAFTAFAVHRPDGHVTLVDTGIGHAGSPASGWGVGPGRLPAALQAVGISRGVVDTVVLTHLHEDHCGWVVDPAGVPLFPDAAYLVQQAELTALRSERGSAIWDSAVRPLVDSGQLSGLEGRSRLRGGDRPVCRLTAIPTPGHTPGHQSVLVSGGGERMVITGDLLVHAVQLVSPDVSYRFEADQPRAARSRRLVLRRAARARATLATAHLTTPFVPARTVSASH